MTIMLCILRISFVFFFRPMRFGMASFSVGKSDDRSSFSCFLKPLLPFLLLLPTFLGAQMPAGRDTLYGNEWIDHDRVYYKIPVAEDGFYRITGAALGAAGLPVAETASVRYQLFHFGEELPLYTSADPGTPLAPGDYLEFYSSQNRARMDRYLFQYPDEDMPNPRYSLFTDTAAYYLTIAPAGNRGLRYREAANDLTGLPEQTRWFWDTLNLEFKERAYNKTYAQNLVTYSAFDEGEGFAGALRNRHELTLRPDNAAVEAELGGRLKLRLLTERGDHHLQVAVNDRIVYSDSTLQPFSLHALELEVFPGELERPVSIRIEGLLGEKDTYAVAACALVYPAVFSFPESPLIRFSLDAEVARQHVVLEELPDSLSGLVLYDLQNQLRLPISVTEGRGVVAWPKTPEKASIAAGLHRTELTSAQLKEVVFRDLRREDAQYLIISHPTLIGAVGRQVQAYADYRRSQAGGGYRTVVIDVEDLYDQFGYGISQHSQALRNFGFFAKRHWKDLRFILLLGQAIDYALIRQPGDPRRRQNLVPTFGTPGSDQLLFSPNGSSVPLAAVGRLAASTPQEIEVYLDKVRTHEEGLNGPLTYSSQAWRKRLLHLVGGDLTEKAGFRLRMDDMAAELTNNGYGAEVRTVSRTSNDPVQSSLSQEVIDAINEGVGIKTFLGHGGVTTTDFGLDDPYLFENAGRYPLMFSLGCLSGYISDFQNSLSERFVFAPKRGGIAYIATAGFASEGPLAVTTKKFYDLIGGDLYGYPVGEILNEVRRTYDAFDDIFYRSLLEQLTYHGDPALRINRAPAPDYLVDFNSVAFTPPVAGTNTDSIEVRFTLANIGLVQPDSLVINYVHAGPEGEEASFLDTVPGGTSFREVPFRFPIDGATRRGINHFRIELDPEDAIEEGPAPAAEQNNRLSGPNGESSVTFFVTGKSVEPVYPPAFAIIGEEDLMLRAAPADLFSKNINYRLEVDTTALFNSPGKYNRLLSSEGGLLEHQPPIDWQDNRVYYWRISPDSLSNPEIGYQWERRSFLFREGADEGWNQSHYFQFAEDGFDGVELDEERRSLRYSEVLTAVSAFAEIFSLEDNNVTSRIFLDNSRVVRNWPPPSLGILVLDPLTGAVVQQGVFPLDRDDKRREAIVLLQSVPDGYYTVVVTFRDEEETYALDQWETDSAAVGATLYGVLEAEGAASIRELSASGEAPYAVAYRKGRGIIRERLGSPGDLSANIYFEIPSVLSAGSITSTPIGPARTWKTMEWQYLTSDMPRSDSLALYIYGLPSRNSTPELLWSGTQERLPLDFIDPAAYPYLQLKFFSSDTLRRTAPQLDFWRVLYEQEGDLVLNPVSFHRDTLQRGEILALAYDIHNFSSRSTDSLTVQVTIRDGRNELFVRREKQAPVAGFGISSGRFTFDSRVFEVAGDYQFTVEVNPDRQLPERNFLNNTGVKPFHVLFDRQNPLLDVTFDGQHIMNGDLVSGRPFIVISLRDENPFFPIRDTSAFDIRLQYPDGEQRQVYFSNEEVLFIPAEKGEVNKARIEFSPVLLQDGTYRLWVQGRDENGNEAGQYEYSVSFEVDNRQRISNILPYPNPFSTATRFSYTMTGAGEPAHFLIQIMTVSGRVVREITREEFGPLRVGTHLSDFVWDGTDQYGDRLANGVYLYRVVVKNEEGADYGHYENETDRFFRKDIGKIVILR